MKYQIPKSEKDRMSAIKRLLMKGLAKLSRKPKAKVSLERLEGFIIDIGAGGEGVIAKTCGRNTVGVDIRKGEIDEARSRGSLAQWVLCDACSMPFRNDAFDVATFFFSLMYIRTPKRKRAAFAETRRILKSDGLLRLWAAIVREKPDLYVVFVETSLPDGEEIFTGYGVRGKKKEQNLELINKLAVEAGFKAKSAESHKDWIEACFH
jgi:ubiquinone/menaquinone biosynthesis C-methylase UbiE